MKKLEMLLFLNVWIFLFLITGTGYAAEEGENIVRNNDFEDGVDQWQLLVTAPAAATWEEEEEGVVGKCVHITINNVTGTDWHVEIHQGGQMLKAGHEYTFNFWVKTADVASRPVGPGIEGIGGSDWWETYSATEEWQEYSKTWTQTMDGNATIHFGLGQVKGDIWLDHIRLYEGKYVEEDVEALTPEQAVELGNKLAVTWGSIRSAN